MIRTTVVVLAGALALAGCGGSQNDGSTSEEPSTTVSSAPLAVSPFPSPNAAQEAALVKQQHLLPMTTATSRGRWAG